MDDRHPYAVTPERARSIALDDEVVTFAVHPALVPDLVGWLNHRGLDLVPGPAWASGDPVYIASPRSR